MLSRQNPRFLVGSARSHAAAVTLTLATLMSAGRVSAQEAQVQIQLAPPEQVQELILTDGSVLYGRVVQEGDPFRFVLVSGVENVFPLRSVRSLRQAQGQIEGGEFWPEDPNRTRLLFGPTARSLPRGKGYLSVYQLFIPFLAFGISDSFLVAGGTPLIFGKGDSRPFWLAPKLRVFQGESTAVAVGALAVTVEDEDAGMLYGVVTRGSPTGSVTVGLGYGYANGDLADNPAVMLGGEIRLSRGTKLITENYLFPEGGGGGVVSLGTRFLGRRLSADVGLGIPVGGTDTFIFPLVNFVWNF